MIIKLQKIFPILFISLLILSLGIFYSAYFERNSDKLTVSFLNVGQGDAIFIQSPNGTQVLLDSGGGRQILKQLGEVMPFYDRTIDMIIVSNPDKDHIGGFLDVLPKYKVLQEVVPGTISTTATNKELIKEVEEEGAKVLVAKRGQEIVLDSEKNIYIKVLYPDKDVSDLSTNDGSLVAKLIYGKTSVLLQGDATEIVETHLLDIEKENELDSDILKVGHHGSRTSTVKEYVEASTPEYAVISLGKDNSYGHPHKETLDTLNSLNIPIFRTDLMGRITFVSDGEKFVLEKSSF